METLNYEIQKDGSILKTTVSKTESRKLDSSIFAIKNTIQDTEDYLAQIQVQADQQKKDTLVNIEALKVKLEEMEKENTEQEIPDITAFTQQETVKDKNIEILAIKTVLETLEFNIDKEDPEIQANVKDIISNYKEALVVLEQ